MTTEALRRWLCFEESHNSGGGYLPRLVDAVTAQDAARQVGGLNRMVYVFPQEEARPFHTATTFGRVEAEPPRGGDFYSGNGRAAGAAVPPPATPEEERVAWIRRWLEERRPAVAQQVDYSGLPLEVAVSMGLELLGYLDTARAGDAYVIVRGGLVVNEPALPVLDLDCLEDRDPTAGTYEEVVERADRARELGLTEVAAECDDWLAGHPTLRPER